MPMNDKKRTEMMKAKIKIAKAILFFAFAISILFYISNCEIFRMFSLEILEV